MKKSIPLILLAALVAVVASCSCGPESSPTSIPEPTSKPAGPTEAPKAGEPTKEVKEPTTEPAATEPPARPIPLARRAHSSLARSTHTTAVGRGESTHPEERLSVPSYDTAATNEESDAAFVARHARPEQSVKEENYRG